MKAGTPFDGGGNPNSLALPCSRNNRAIMIRTMLSISGVYFCISGVYFSTRSRFINGSRDSQIDRTNLSKDLWFQARMSDHGSLNRREHSAVGSSSTLVPTLALGRRKPPSPREKMLSKK